MSSTIVHLVRHGEVHNPEKILYGRMPGYTLSERGRKQAATTAAAFADHDVAYLAASPLQRVQETAEPFVAITGLELNTDDDLLEAGNRFEGLRTRGWRSQLLNPVRWQLMYNPLQPSWGEHYVDIAARVMKAVDRAREAAEGREAILVSHQLPIVCIQRAARGQRLWHNPAKRQCDLASVTSLVFQDDQIVDVHYTEPAQEL